MNDLFRRGMRHLHEQAVAEFADEAVKLWFPASRDVYEFTVGIAAVKGSTQIKTEGLGGMLTQRVDGMTASALKEDFPFEPRTDDLFLRGPAQSGNANLPDEAACERFIIVGASTVEGAAHWRITAKRHA